MNRIPSYDSNLVCCELLILAHFQSIKAQLTRQKSHIVTSLFQNRIRLDHTLPTSPHLLKSDELFVLALFSFHLFNLYFYTSIFTPLFYTSIFTPLFLHLYFYTQITPSFKFRPSLLGLGLRRYPH